MVTIYGIGDCDAMKKACKWLDEHGAEYAFHDYIGFSEGGYRELFG
jgi:arsenate reductase